MRFGIRKLSVCGRVFISVVTLLVAGCSKPEEVINRRLADANQKIEEGAPTEAVEILEKLNRKFPDQARVLEALGFAYAQVDRQMDAATAFVAAADADPEAAYLRQFAAEAYLREDKLNEAAEQYRLYIAAYPDDYQGWKNLGETEERLGNITRAIEAYLEWYRLRPSGVAALRLGKAFRKLNNTPQAKSWFETTIKHGDDAVKEALLGLLEIEVEAGDMAAAEKTVGQLDRNFPGTLDASDLAGVRERIAAWRKAQEALEQARAEQERLARELEEARRRQQREAQLAAERQREAARQREAEAAAAAAADTPGTAPTAPSTAPVRTEPDTPLAALQSASRPAPAQIPEDLAAAIARRESGDPDGAADMLWRALGEDDTRVDLWVELADIYREQKQYSAAEACILEARRLAPDSIEVETAYLNIVRESQPRDVYLARVQSAREKFPANANLAWVYARELAELEGDAARTIAAFEDFLLLADPADPRRAEAAAYLARNRR